MDRRLVMQRPSLATRMRDHQHNVDDEDEDVANIADEGHVHPVSYREDFRQSMRSLDESAVSFSSPTPGGGTGAGGGRTRSGRSIGTHSTIRDNDPSRLCAICEEAISIFVPDDHDDGEPTHKELARRRDALDKAWRSMREWFSTHPSQEERFRAATYLGQLNSTPLHGACKLPDPPADIIQKLIDCAPETVGWADNNGWLPLHIACATGAPGEILSKLVDAYPEGKVAQDRRMRTPLHFAFNPRFGAHSASSDEAETKEGSGTAEGENQATANGETGGKIGNSLPAIIRLLSNSGAAGIPEQNGMLPLHYACAYGTSTAVLEVLFEAFPNSVIAKEKSGRTPLHLAMVNAHRPASPSVLRFLLSIKNVDVVNARDREGHLPLHPLANIAAKLGPEKQSKRQNVKQCLKMYLKAEPHATADFLTDIQSLPGWLRDEAVVTSHVQGVLNNKIVQRFPTSVLIFDGYVLLLIIICFELSSIEHINYRFDETKPEPTKDLSLVFLFIGGVYFLLREIVQVISLINLGFFRSWMTDWTNWLDMLVIVLTFYTGAAMVDDNLGSDDDFRTLCAFTKLVLWAAMIIFFKSIQVDFAVFVDGVFYVVQRLVAFLIAMAVILVMFALMFLVVYRETSTCTDRDDDDTFPHCSFEDSLLKVYTMMMGEIGEVKYEDRPSNIAIFLFVGYAFLVVILLSNVVIAIVTDSYKVIKNERAAMVFWSNRLDFVAEMDAIASVKRKIQNPTSLLPFSEGGGGAGTATSATTSVDTPNGGRSGGGGSGYYSDGGQKREPFKEVWSQLTSLFDPNLYDDIDIDTKTYEFWCYVFFKFLAITVIIPLWLIVGAATAGWLWPPQVRKFLFVQKRNTTMNEDLNEEVEKNTNHLKEQIRFLRKKLMGEMVVGRRELTQVRLNLDGITNDFMADLLQVKEIMTSLLELSRELQPVREEVDVVSIEEEERLSLEAIQRMQAEEQQRFHMEEQQRMHAEEQHRLQAEEQQRLQAEEEQRLYAEQQQRLQEEQQRRLQAEEQQRLQEEQQQRRHSEEPGDYNE